MAITTDNGKLSVIEWEEAYEPSLPLSPGDLGENDQQQIIWGFSEISWSGAIPLTEAQQLSLLEWDIPWEPGLPLSPDTLGQDDQQELLNDLSEPAWLSGDKTGSGALTVAPVLSGYGGIVPLITDNEKIAVQEWDAPWEPGLPLSPGTLGQDDQQQLLIGMPSPAWGAPPANTGTGALVAIPALSSIGVLNHYDLGGGDDIQPLPLVAGEGGGEKTGDGGAVSAPVVAGAGAIGRIGTGAAISRPAITGSGHTETPSSKTGTGAAKPLPALSGSGNLARIGTGSLVVVNPHITGSGVKGKDGNGAINASPMVSGVGTLQHFGSGAIHPRPGLHGGNKVASVGFDSIRLSIRIKIN